MKVIAGLKPAEQRELFEETARRMNVRPVIVEKDFWVCWTLRFLFSTDGWPERLLFKGGTSLSKAFNLIDRFSEDIDLVLKVDGFPEGEMLAERSGKQQKKYLNELLTAAVDYILGEIQPGLASYAEGICEVRNEDGKPSNLLVIYPKCLTDADYGSQYIPPHVKLEIGPRGLWGPCLRKTIKPYAAEHFPGVFRTSGVDLLVLDVVLTFWEKAIILHVQANVPESGKLTRNCLRLSRHYYDLAMMINSAYREQALKRLDLLSKAALFSKRFYRDAKADYEQAIRCFLTLVPTGQLRAGIARDYQLMHDEGMFFGEDLSFQEILERLQSLQAEISSSR